MDSSNLTYSWAAILGFIQGVTEFLPVSSSAHLALAEHLGHGVVENFAYDILLHLATVIAVVGAFYRDILEIIKTRSKWVVVGYIIFGSIPAAFVGLLFKDYIEGLAQNPVIICCCLMLTASLLMLAQKATDSNITLQKTGWLRAFEIGCFQVVGMLPGVSRSGSTIAGGVLLKLDKEAAVKFSFFLMIPAVLGANFINLIKDPEDILTLPVGPAFTGCIIALASGLVAARLMLKIVKGKSLSWFALYCAFVGVLGLIYFGFIAG